MAERSGEKPALLFLPSDELEEAAAAALADQQASGTALSPQSQGDAGSSGMFCILTRLLFIYWNILLHDSVILNFSFFFIDH